MKTKTILCTDILKSLRFFLYFIIVLLSVSTITSCETEDKTDKVDTFKYSEDDMLGTWQRHSVVTNSSNQGFWIRATLQNTEESQTAHYVLPNGHNMDTTYTGMVVTMTQDGVITTPSDPAAHSYLSTDKNLWVGTTKRDDLYTLVIDQKSITGTSYSASDFQGTWQTHYLVAGGTWTGWIHAVSVLDNNGTCISNSLVKSDGETGTTSGGTNLISTDGIISYETVPGYHGFMSVDKKLMVTNMTDGGGGGGLSIAQKMVDGTSYSIADLKGKWQLHDIIVGSENWTEHGNMTIDSLGNAEITNLIRDDGEIFDNPGPITFVISAGGIVTFDQDFHGFLSADKKLMIGTRGDAENAYSLIVLQKMP